MKTKKEATSATTPPKREVEVRINWEDRSQDAVVIKRGDTIVKVIPTLIFDSKQVEKIYQLIDEAD